MWQLFKKVIIVKNMLNNVKNVIVKKIETCPLHLDVAKVKYLDWLECPVVWLYKKEQPIDPRFQHVLARN